MYQFEIPVVFDAAGVPKRGTHARVVPNYIPVTVTVPQIGADEAPVAATFPAPLHSFSYHSLDGTCTLRLHEGRLVSRVLPQWHGARRPVTPRMVETFLAGLPEDRTGDDWCVQQITGKDPDVLRRALFPGRGEHKPILPFDPALWKRVSTEDFEREKAKLLKLHDGSAVIDGEFWLPVDEPRYMATYFAAERERPASALVEVGDNDAARRRSRHDVYGFNDWKIMASELANAYGVGVDEAMAADVFIPSAFPFSVTLDAFERGLSGALSHDGDMLKTFDPGSMLAWAAFRDEFLAAKADAFGEDACHAAVEAAEAYAACAKASANAVSMIRQAVKAWDARPVDIDAASGTLRPR
jgi:hypothetical protein